MMKAIIFDFDGLVVDTETVWYDVFRELFAEHGCELTLDIFSQVIGTTDEVLHDYYCRNAANPVELDVLQQMARERYNGRMEGLALREGVLEYLQEARELGLKIGLASSSKRYWIKGFLQRLGIESYFETMKTQEDVVKVKPDPELYVQAVRDLGVLPEEAIAFEDSVNGSVAAKKAGLHCVAVPNSVTKHLSFTHCALQLSSMKEKSLAEVIRQIQG